MFRDLGRISNREFQLHLLRNFCQQLLSRKISTRFHNSVQEMRVQMKKSIKKFRIVKGLAWSTEDSFIMKVCMKSQIRLVWNTTQLEISWTPTKKTEEQTERVAKSMMTKGMRISHQKELAPAQFSLQSAKMTPKKSSTVVCSYLTTATVSIHTRFRIPSKR